MKALTVIILAVALATGPAYARKSSSSGSGTGGGYFYVTAGVDTDSDGDANLVASAVFSTEAACETSAASASDLIQGCVATYDPANPKTDYYMEQKVPTKFVYQPIGPYGFEGDCEAGIGLASSVGITNVMPECTVFSNGSKGR